MHLSKQMTRSHPAKLWFNGNTQKRQKKQQKYNTETAA